MKNRTINVKGSEVTIATRFGQDYISLTDMFKGQGRRFFYFGLVAEQEHR